MWNKYQPPHSGIWSKSLSDVQLRHQILPMDTMSSCQDPVHANDGTPTEVVSTNFTLKNVAALKLWLLVPAMLCSSYSSS